MKIEIQAQELKMINDAIEVKTATIQRAINTEKDNDVRELRTKSLNGYKNLQARLNTMELPK